MRNEEAEMSAAAWITTMALASVVCATPQDIPPLAPLRGDAATLKDTLKFVQEKLPGKVSYIIYPHDNVAGSDLTPIKRSFKLSDVSVDADHCSISFHGQFDKGGDSAYIDKDSDLSLKEVKEITSTQLEQVIQLGNAKAGHPEIGVKVDPAIFVVVVKSNRSTMFNFFDENLADRVSKALQHAVDLCGGGHQDPF
jgi:hypothetical protein